MSNETKKDRQLMLALLGWTSTFWRIRPLAGVLVVLMVLVQFSAAADIVFLDGKKLNARTLSKTSTHLIVEVEVAGKKVRRELDLSKIHKVTINEKTHVLNKLSSAASSTGSSIRSEKELAALIDQMGRTPPQWYDSTELTFPETLDLAWPMPAPKPWNNRKNIGQYVWDVINPNPSRWQGGIRLMHHLLQLHQDNPELRTRVMKSLAGMYFRFFQDYARAAFWWQKAGIQRGPESLGLAECYWRLGNKRRAKQMIDNRRVQVATIKLLGDMGDTKNALRIAELYADQAQEPQWALIAAGDACRTAGQYKKAVEYYERALNWGEMRNEQYDRRLTDRAKQNIEATNLFRFSDPKRARDGTFTADSMGYEGPVVVEMRIRGGKIENVAVTEHKEKQFYSAMRDVPSQIIDKQSVKNIDATSRATITADAIVHASAKALSKATKQGR